VSASTAPQDKGWPEQSASLSAEEAAQLTPLSDVAMHRQATINIGRLRAVQSNERKRAATATKRSEHDERAMGPAQFHSSAAPRRTSGKVEKQLNNCVAFYLLRIVPLFRHDRSRGPRQVHGGESHLRSANCAFQDGIGTQHHHQARVCQCKDLQVRQPQVPEAQQLQELWKRTGRQTQVRTRWMQQPHDAAATCVLR
jgi:hypothetical protein